MLAYRDEQGQLHQVAPFIGDDEFSSHLLKVMGEKQIQVELLILPRVSVQGRDERTLAKDLREMMSNALQDLHQKTLAC